MGDPFIVRGPFRGRSPFVGNSPYQFNIAATWAVDATGAAIRDAMAALTSYGYSAHNTLTYSQQIDNAAWTKTSLSVSADAVTAPDGTQTADKLIPAAGSGQKYVVHSTSVAANIAGVFSVYAKAAEFDTLTLSASGSSSFSAQFLLTGSGTVNSVSGGVATITAVGSGWYRCVLAATTTAFAFAPYMHPKQYASFTANGTDGIYVWGAQLNLGPTALTYVATTSAAKGPTAPGYVLPGTAGARLNAAARTSAAMQLRADGTYEYAAHNLLLYSEQLDNAYYGLANATLSANQTTGPTGLQTADQLVNTATTAEHGIYRQAGSQIASIPYTLSCYVKKNTVRYVALGQWNSGTAQCGAGFDLDTNTVTGTGNGAVAGYSASNASIVEVGGGWVRLSVTCITTSTTNYPSIIHRSIAYTSGVLVDSYAGLTSQSTYVWGFQMTFAPASTSYVPTTTAAVYAPAVDWVSAASAYGVRSENAATNRVTYSRDLTNAAWTATNATATLTATGIGGTANMASVVTATAANATVLQAITHASTERTLSIFLKRRTGTGTVETTIDGGSTWVARTLTTSWQRFTTTATLANPSVGIRIVTSGDAVDVDAVQEETGAIATSPIFTYSASATRAADTLTVPDTAPSWIGQTMGTLAVEGVAATIGTNGMVSLNDASANNRAGIRSNDTAIVTVGGSDVLTPAIATMVSGTFAKSAMGFTLRRAGASRAASVPTGTGDAPALTQIQIGGLDGVATSNCNGQITRVRYSATQLPDASLTVLTT